LTAVAVAVLALAAAGAGWAYDSSHRDEIAEGITIGGGDVGGLTEAQAEAKLRRRFLDPMRESFEVGFDVRTWKLAGEKPKVHAELGPAVAEAIDRSQEGGLPGRLARYLGGEEIEESIEPDLTYSKPAINRFVRHLATEIDREPEDASVEPSADSLEVVSGHEGASFATTCSPISSRRQC
jgi:hypothetical protein